MYRPMTICENKRWSFWCWFDVNRSTFYEDVCKNDFCIFVPSDLDLLLFWTQNHFNIYKCKDQLPPIKYELSTVFQYWVNETCASRGGSRNLKNDPPHPVLPLLFLPVISASRQPMPPLLSFLFLSSYPFLVRSFPFLFPPFSFSHLRPLRS